MEKWDNIQMGLQLALEEKAVTLADGCPAMLKDWTLRGEGQPPGERGLQPGC